MFYIFVFCAKCPHSTSYSPLGKLTGRWNVGHCSLLKISFQNCHHRTKNNHLSTICQPSVNMKKNGRNVVPPPPELLSLSPEVRNAKATGNAGNVERLIKTKPVLTSISPGYPWIKSPQKKDSIDSITSHALLPSHLWQGPVHTKCLGRTAMTLSWIVQWAIPQPGINKPSPITMRLQYCNHSRSCWQILASDQWLDKSKLVQRNGMQIPRKIQSLSPLHCDQLIRCETPWICWKDVHCSWKEHWAINAINHGPWFFHPIFLEFQNHMQQTWTSVSMVNLLRSSRPDQQHMDWLVHRPYALSWE